MIGPRYGSRYGALYGAKFGSGADDEGVSVVATRDATSNIYVPQNLTEWNSVLAAAGIGSGGPSHLWLCQEASNNLADTIGTANLTATGLTYSNAITGWTRVAVGSVLDSAASNGVSTDASLPAVNTTSALVLAYIAQNSAPAAERHTWALGTSTTTKVDVLTTRNYKVYSGANTANGTAGPGGTVHPLVHRFDRTNSATKGYTDQEIITPTHAGTPTGVSFRIGDGVVTAADNRWLYMCMFQGAAAELTDAQIRTLLQTLGWTIPW